MATQRRTRVSDPESLLIDLLADEIERDEQLIEALGGGLVSLEDVEAWHAQRARTLNAFLEQGRRLIGEMKADGYGRTMRRTGDRTASPRRGGGPLKFGERGAASRPPAPAKKASPGPRRFYLDLKDLGAGCSLRLSGDYDEILDAGAWHLRHAHKLHGSEASVREVVESAISEVPTARLSLEERTHGLRTEETVSNEMANKARSSRGSGGYASA